jgi:hypothetical protein
MNIFQGTRFVHRFAGRDLIHGGAWRPTIVNIFSTALVTAVTLTAIGLALGSAERKRLEMQERGLPPLYCGNPSIQGMVGADLPARLDEALDKKFGKGAARSYPFHALQELNFTGSKRPVPMRGRTVVEGDPIRKRVKLLRGEWPAQAVDAGFVVTEQFLEKIGKPNANPPLDVNLELKNSDRAVSVIGVVDHLPLTDDFVLTEAYYRELSKWDWEGRSVWAESGPVGPGWPDPAQLDGNPITALENDKIARPQPTPAGAGKVPRWNLTADDNKERTRRTWVKHFKDLRDALNKKDDKDFADVDKIQLGPRDVCDVRLMDAVNESDSPAEGNNVIFVAAVNGKLQFRIFENNGQRVVNTDEVKLKEEARPINALRKQLDGLWPPHSLTESEKTGVIAAVASIVGYTPRQGPFIPRQDWHLIGIYADTLDHLKEARAVATSDPFFLPEQKDKVYDLENFEQASSRPLWGAVIAGLVLLLNSCANLMVIQQLRAALKVAEIGMLKAMGMGAGLLRTVFLYEGLLIWVAGTLIGIPVGYGLGVGVSAAFIAEPGHVLEAFYCPGYLWLLPFVLLPFFLFSTWFGTRRSRRLPPIQTLRSS